MHSIEVVHTRVFAAGPAGGNLCPVIRQADRLADNVMQSLARRFGLDTAFILEPQTKGTDIRLRYFVPDHEMGVSGHATIAALTVALQKGLRPKFWKVETLSGIFGYTCARKDDQYVVTLAQNPPVFESLITSDKVAIALNLSVNDIASNESPIQVVSVSRPKLIIPI